MNNREKGIVILITTAGTEEANIIADKLVGSKKAACVNIVPVVSSVFRWAGNIENEDENLLIVKSVESCLDDIVSMVKQLHSYEVPEVIALPIIGGNPEYLEWLDKETNS